MKILTVGIRWPAEPFLSSLLEGLSKEGHDITVCHRNKPYKTAAYRPSWIHPFLLQWNSLKKWDIIYFPWNSAAIENLNLFGRGTPCVVSCRGSQINIAPHNPERQSLKDGLKEIFEKAEKVHCVSETIQAEAQKYGLKREKSKIIRPAVDTRFFSPDPLAGARDSGIFRIITVGHLNWIKGYEYALIAVKQLKDRGVKLHFEIIGEGPDKQRILYTIQDLGLEKEVSLSGKLSTEKIREKLHKADIFTLSSLSEGISNAVLEAMACGVAIVTADCGGMREAVTDKVEGYVVPARDPSAMAEAVLELIQNPKSLLSVRKAARERVLREFDIKNQIKEFISLFEMARSKT